MVVVEILGVVNVVVPVPPLSKLPPLAAAYQSIVQPEGTLVTPIATVPVPHLDPFEAEANAGIACIVAVTAVRELLTQPVVVFLVWA